MLDVRRVTQVAVSASADVGDELTVLCQVTGGPIFEKSYEDLRKILRLMKILGKTYDNADFRKILRKT